MSVLRTLGTISDQIRGRQTTAERERDDLRKHCTQLEKRNAELEQWDRIRWEYFKAIESMEKERDKVKAMWWESSQKHTNAQALLQRHVTELRILIARAVVRVNKLQDPSLPPMTVQSLAAIDPPDGPPVGVALEYFKQMVAMSAALPDPFNVRESLKKLDDGADWLVLRFKHRLVGLFDELEESEEKLLAAGVKPDELGALSAAMKVVLTALWLDEQVPMRADP